MKKQALFGVIMATVLLAGCEMPFVATEKAALEKFVNAQAELLQSSLDIDGKLQQSLENTLKETEKKVFPSEQLINEVRSAKQTQNELYLRIQKQKEPYGKDHVKNVYLSVIETHIASYQQYEQLIKVKDAKTLGTTLAHNQIKEEDVMAQSLVLLNYELSRYKIDERVSLLPLEKN